MRLATYLVRLTATYCAYLPIAHGCYLVCLATYCAELPTQCVWLPIARGYLPIAPGCYIVRLGTYLVRLAGT